jgi:hypothetical protein
MFELKHIETGKLVFLSQRNSMEEALHDAILHGADLDQANLDGIVFTKGIRNALLGGASMVGARVDVDATPPVFFENVEMSHCDLSGADFATANLTSVKMKCAKLNNAKFGGVLDHVDFRNTHPFGLDFSGSISRSLLFHEGQFHDVKGLDPSIHNGSKLNADKHGGHPVRALRIPSGVDGFSDRMLHIVKVGDAEGRDAMYGIENASSYDLPDTITIQGMVDHKMDVVSQDNFGFLLRQAVFALKCRESKNVILLEPLSKSNTLSSQLVAISADAFSSVNYGNIDDMDKCSPSGLLVHKKTSALFYIPADLKNKEPLSELNDVLAIANAGGEIDSSDIDPENLSYLLENGIATMCGNDNEAVKLEPVGGALAKSYALHLEKLNVNVGVQVNNDADDNQYRRRL